MLMAMIIPKNSKNVSLNRHLSKLLLSIIIIACTMNRSVCCQNCGPDGYCEDETSVAAMSSIYIPRLKEMLNQSVNALSPSMSFEEKDETSVAALIFESMYTPGRVYHSMDHVFNIIENCNVQQSPILVLSTLFHDVIYYSVDKSFNKLQLELFEGVLVFENNNDEGEDKGQGQLQLQQPLLLTPHVQEDPLFDMVLRLFDLEAGMPLRKFGTNEFLSAVIGVRILSKWLSLPQLTQLTAAIEGTIPFRPPNSEGKTAMDRLYDRLVMVASNQSEDWLTKTIHLSAAMANCDLCSFYSSDFDFFLDSNWSLIPEFRPALLKEDCPLREYYDEFLAMEGRTKFLISAVPNIFQVFRNVPSENELSVKQAKTHKNLNLGNEYSQVRRLQFMVLMEFVTIVGEDPDIIPGRPFLRLVLPRLRPLSEEDDGDDEVRRLLDHGRRACFLWDPARSSLGAFLYDNLGKKGVDTAVEVGKNQTPGSDDLLRHLPKDIVAAIASSLGDVLPNRSEAFLQISNRLEEGSPLTCLSPN